MSYFSYQVRTVINDKDGIAKGVTVSKPKFIFSKSKEQAMSEATTKHKVLERPGTDIIRLKKSSTKKRLQAKGRA